MEFAVAVANITNGRAAASMYFLPKITGINSMDTPLTEKQIKAVNVIGMVVLPVVLVIGGVVVWFRRRRR